MADPKVLADAVQQAQVVLQNQAQEGQAPAALAEQAQVPVAPEEQAQPPAQAPVQANEVSLEVCETLFYPFVATCFVLVLQYFASKPCRLFALRELFFIST